jgi:hypothetical protein
MKKLFIYFLFITSLIQSAFSIDFIEEESINSIVPITVTVRSINDLKVKENQIIKIGQVLAYRPLDPEIPQGYISTKHDGEVQKQKDYLKEVKQIVKENNLPNAMIEHEEAILKDLEFTAKEFKKSAISPKAFKETTYKSPINGKIKRIIPSGGSDGKLNIEIIVESI